MGQGWNQRENFTNTSRQMTIKTQPYKKSMGYSKCGLKSKVYSK